MRIVDATLDLCGILIILIVLYGVKFELSNDKKKKTLMYIVIASLASLITHLLMIYYLSKNDMFMSDYFLLLNVISFFCWIQTLFVHRRIFIPKKNRRHEYTTLALVVVSAVTNLVAVASGNLFSSETAGFTISPIVFIASALDVILVVYYVYSCIKIGKAVGLNDTIAMIGHVAILLFLIFSGIILNCSSNLSFGISLSLLLSFVMTQNKTMDAKEGKIKDLNAELKEQYEQLKEDYTIITSICKVFYSIHYIDIDNDYFYQLGESINSITNSVGLRGSARQAFRKAESCLVTPDYKSTVHEFCNLDTLSERMKNKEFISEDFYSYNEGWSLGVFIAGDRHEDGSLKNVFWAVKDNNLEKQKELSYQTELATALDEAMHANNAKTIFLNNMSHDIRTPMNAILGFAQLIKQDPSNERTVVEYIDKVQVAGDYLLSIINNVLDLSKINSGKVEIVKTFTDLYSKDSSVLDFFNEEIERKKLNLNANMTDIKHRYVFADMAKCKQIMINLVSNAIKYTQEGGTINVELKEVPCEQPGYATYTSSVSDNGVGIEPEYLPRIFDAFSREKNSTEGKIIGTGLGMAIVKKLVDMMNGTIEIESEKGKGTTVRVTITHKIAEEPAFYIENNITTEVEKDHTGKFMDKRVLLVEDNELNTEIAEMVLVTSGYMVETAGNGKECLKLIREHPSDYYSIVLMDIQMPIMDGYVTTRIIRSDDDTKKSNIPIIAMSANAFDEDKQKAFETGMNSYIAKPFNAKDLLKEISVYI